MMNKVFKAIPTIFRRKKKVQVPELDFDRTHADLSLELTYASNLMQTLATNPNRPYSLVQQLHGCLALIRARVATGAACIRPTSSAAQNGLEDVEELSGSREVLCRLAEFRDSYLEFFNWLDQMASTLMLSPGNVPAQLLKRGTGLFSALHTSASLVFETLKKAKLTQPVHPQHLEALFQSAPLNSYDHSCSPSTSTLTDQGQTNSTNMNGSSGGNTTELTQADRNLLTQLWSHVDALDSMCHVPGKPPLPSHGSHLADEAKIGSMPLTIDSAVLNTLTSSVDPQLFTYLEALAHAVDVKPRLHSIDSSTKPLVSPTTDSGFDLNAPHAFPAMDASVMSSHDDVQNTVFEVASETSDKDPTPPNGPSLFNGVASGDRPRSVSTPTVSGQLNLTTRIIAKPLPLSKGPPPPPPPATTSASTRNFALFSEPIGTGLNKASTPCGVCGTRILDQNANSGCGFDSLNPLDDHQMEENIATVAMRLQTTDPRTIQTSITNPLLSTPTGHGCGRVEDNHCAITLDPYASSTDRCFGCRTNNEQCSPLSNSDAIDSTPVCQSEVKADTEDDFELIEVDGKKYRRHFRRHIVIERHKLRQVVVAPSLPDGTGPDLSRAVSLGEESSCANKPPVHPGLVGRATADLPALPRHTTSSISPTSERRSFTDNPISTEMNTSSNDPLSDVDDSDMDEDEFDGQRTPPPPKPPLRHHMLSRPMSHPPLTNYMFRFGPTEHAESDLDNRLSNQLIDFFRAHWHKQESAEGPHLRSKTMRYVQTYAQPSPEGDVHRSTCVEHTCTVRMNAHPNSVPEDDGELSDLASKLDAISPTDTGRLMNLVSPSPESLEFGPLVTLQSPEPSIPFNVDENLDVVSTSSGCEDILGLVRADDYLLFAPTDRSSEVSVQAGCVDALIVHLTSVGKPSIPFYLFYETFLFTYPVFLQPQSLIARLIMRYRLFHDHTDEEKKLNIPTAEEPSYDEQVWSKVRAATVSLLIAVISRLKSDLTPTMQKSLEEFQTTLNSDKSHASLSKALESVIAAQLSPLPASPCETELNGTASSSSHSDDSKQPQMHSKIAGPFPLLSTRARVPPSVSQRRPERHSLTELDEAYGRGSLAEQLRAKESVIRGSNPSLHTSLSPSNSMILRENSHPSLLNFSARELAEQMTCLEAKKYEQIKISELLNIENLEKGKAPGVASCAAHFSAVSMWASNQIQHAPATERDKHMHRLLDVMEHLRKIQNFSSFLSILCIFLLIPERQLPRRVRVRLDRVRPYMQPPFFCEYRRELAEASPPYIPYLGLMMQNLIALSQSNPIFLPEPPKQMTAKYNPKAHGPIVNVWRCWKHFLIIHFIVKQEKMDQARNRYDFKPNHAILNFLNDFKNPD